MMRDKRGISGGLSTGFVMGIAGLIIAVIIALVITQTLNTSNLLTDGRTTATVNNETGNVTTSAYLNNTGYTLVQVYDDYVSGTFTITDLYNATANTSIPTANATVSSAGVVTNATSFTCDGADTIMISYTYTNKSIEEMASDDLSKNFSSGVDNVSEKVPTTLLLIAVILIIAVLAVLIGVWHRMNLGGKV